MMFQGLVEIVEDKRFIPLSRWMRAKTGWGIGEYSKTAILVFKPTRKASWKM